MAKLPGIQDIGVDRAAPTRPGGGGYDISGYVRGNQALAAGIEKLGQGIGQAAAGVGELAQNESRWEYSKAHADFISRKVDLDAAVAKDTNYGPDAAGKDLPTRYTEQLTALRAQAGNMIQDPHMRDLFMTHTASTFEQGKVAAQSHARSLSNDAQVAYVGEMGNKAIDQAVKAPDDNTRSQLIDAHNQLVDGLVSQGAITRVQAIAMKQDWAHRYATADVLARADTDPQGVINELRAAPGSNEDVDNRILKIEGRGKNPRSSATGSGNFIDSTWLDVLKRNRPDLAKGRTDEQLLALRADDKLGAEMTSAYRRENSQALQKQGLPVTPGNIYLSHFLGPGGAAAVLKADPNQPVEEVLATAVGAKKAKQMVEANPEVLGGKLAGSVTDWANGRMGGGSRLVDMLRPDVREQLLARAQTSLDKQVATDTSEFKTRYEDSLAEAGRTGAASQPLTQADFTRTFGAKQGPDRYQDYQSDLKLHSDIAQVARLTPQQQDDLIRSYEPKPGEAGYADQAKRQAALQKAIEGAREGRNATFAAKVKDTLAEAQRTGAVTEPVAKQDFVDALGRDAGMAAWTSYDAELRAQRDIRAVPSSPEDQDRLVKGYEPTPGAPDYAAAAKRQDEVALAVRRARKERDDDPALYAIQRIPSVQDAWQGLSKTLSDPTAPIEVRQAAARDFANKTVLEQQKAGVAPQDVRLLPSGYVEQLKAKLENPPAAGGPDAVVSTIRSEAALWGDNWPQIYRQLAPQLGPVARVIGSGVGDSAARRLAELAPMSVGDILKDQSAEKLSQIRKEVLDAFAPFKASLGGNAGDLPVFNDFRAQAEKLAASYIVAGKSSGDAARQAYKELIGDRYDFRDAWRMPKGLPQSADDIQLGSIRAANELEALGIAPARDNVGGLSPEFLVKSRADTLRRDGVWTTAPDESGLVLTYNDEAVKRADGQPLVLTWGQLGALADKHRADAKAFAADLAARGSGL